MPATLSILGLYSADQSIFTDMSVPEGMNKDLVVECILERCAIFEVLYPDPEFIRQMIRIWSAQCLEVWQHLYDTMHYEYNPIWNKDGKYTEERILNTSASGETTGKVSAYNQSDFTNATRSNSTGSGHEGEKITRTEQGNIGVVTTQQMIREEREIAEFNLYDYIAEDFKNRFCLLVY